MARTGPAAIQHSQAHLCRSNKHECPSTKHGDQHISLSMLWLISTSSVRRASWRREHINADHFESKALRLSLQVETPVHVNHDLWHPIKEGSGNTPRL
eukprot:1160393-Pelagomonas_calceolata.AAC.13